MLAEPMNWSLQKCVWPPRIPHIGNERRSLRFDWAYTIWFSCLRYLERTSIRALIACVFYLENNRMMWWCAICFTNILLRCHFRSMKSSAFTSHAAFPFYCQTYHVQKLRWSWWRLYFCFPEPSSLNADDVMEKHARPFHLNWIAQISCVV